jgi:uncharacterized cupin superfamily protein
MSDSSWFTASLADAEGIVHPQAGRAYLFGEAFPRERYRDLGMNVRVLEPGQAASLYHSEESEEFFLVLGGEALAIVEDEEVSLGTWDYLFCPPGVAHVVVGAGEGPSTVLMAGGRRAESPPRYPVSERAARYGASVSEETSDPQEAWRQAGWEMSFEPSPLPWPPS